MSTPNTPQDAQVKAAQKKAEHREFVANGFKWMQNWPVVLRWLLILPMALISAVLVNFCGRTAEHVFGLPKSGVGWGSIALTLVVAIAVTTVFVSTAAATAPSGRKWVAAAAFAILCGIQILIGALVASGQVALANGLLDCAATGIGTLLGGIWILRDYWKAPT